MIPENARKRKITLRYALILAGAISLGGPVGLHFGAQRGPQGNRPWANRLLPFDRIRHWLEVLPSIPPKIMMAVRSPRSDARCDFLGATLGSPTAPPKEIAPARMSENVIKFSIYFHFHGFLFLLMGQNIRDYVPTGLHFGAQNGTQSSPTWLQGNRTLHLTWENVQPY